MGVPKRRTPKGKVRLRRKLHRARAPAMSACPECGKPRQSHRVCPWCGYYKGRQVVSVKVEERK